MANKNNIQNLITYNGYDDSSFFSVPPLLRLFIFFYNLLIIYIYIYINKFENYD